MATVSIPSFAKINWILKILGKRADGYHQVATVLQTIDLRDEIRLETNPGGRIELEVEGRQVATGVDNLLSKTAALLQSRTGCRAGVRMRLIKRVPVGAGLGGGSANAATLLMALNKLWDLSLSSGQLREIAATLGSDVPFFLLGGTALAEGRGEQLTAWPDSPETALLLLYPGFEISAREAYQKGGWPALEAAPELTIRQVNNKIFRFRSRVERGLSVHDLAENDFDSPLFSEYPLLAKAREGLRRAGCERVMLCGSGSTLLGWTQPDRLESTIEAAARERIGEVLVSRTLSREKYRRGLEQSDAALEF